MDKITTKATYVMACAVLVKSTTNRLKRHAPSSSIYKSNDKQSNDRVLPKLVSVSTSVCLSVKGC